MPPRLKQILLILAALLYVVNPVDLVPDVPGVGWLDDLIVIGLLLWFLSGSGWASWGGARGGTAEQQGETASADPYTTLGIARGASRDEIRSAYRRLVAQYHPDKVSHLGKEFQEIAHQKLISIQQAYELLMARANAK